MFFCLWLKPWKFVGLGICSCGSKLCFHATAWLAVSYFPLSLVTFTRRCSMLNRHCHCRRFYVLPAVLIPTNHFIHPFRQKTSTTSIEVKLIFTIRLIIGSLKEKYHPFSFYPPTPSYHHLSISELYSKPPQHQEKQHQYIDTYIKCIRIRKTKPEQQQKQNTNKSNRSSKSNICGRKKHRTRPTHLKHKNEA